jgi:hypothetical protein
MEPEEDYDDYGWYPDNVYIKEIIREEIRKIFEGGSIGSSYYSNYPDFLDPQFNPQLGAYPPIGFTNYGDMMKEETIESEMTVDFAVEDAKPYKFYLLCDKLCQLKGVETKNQMIADATEVSYEEFVENCSYAESLLEYETINPQSDPGMGFYKSKVDRTPCYYVQYAGFEFIFTLGNSNPDEYWVDEMFDSEGNSIY